MPHVEARRNDEGGFELVLHGEWRAAQLHAIEAELAAATFGDSQHLAIDAGDARFDLAGAWLLRHFLAQLRARQVEANFIGASPEALTLLEHTLERVPQPDAPEIVPFDPAAQAVESVGRHAVRSWRHLSDGLDFFGHVSVTCARSCVSLRRLRPISIARHVYDTGYTAIPIVSLIAFLISVILAYMGAQQLRKFGADIFVVDLVTVGVLRELGVLLTAIIVAGRSGSAFAAEIGSMRLNEEIDALLAIGLDPIEVLVVPRLLGLLIALPLLAVLADGVGLVGGGLLCHALLDMPLTQYLNRVQESIASTTFWVGILKAPVFAVLIALAGCHCGMQVRGSSRDLGRLTTLAVVQSIFFVILADALFAVLFMELDV
jgi:phospholipid/cholesterol/gamma-HCH transport system permease protein